MQISGYIKQSMMDYPGMIASVVFTQGCNFKCPYCHNKELIAIENGVIHEEEVMAHITKNKYLLDGVVITGGEPTLQKQLINFILKIKELGLAVKLDTNGTQTEVLKQLIQDKLTDYIAMDIKSALTIETYKQNTGIELSANTLNNIRESIQMITASGIKHEFRTTICRELITIQNIKSIINTIEGADNYYLQQYRPVTKFRQKNTTYNPFNQEELNLLLNKYKASKKIIQLRN